MKKNRKGFMLAEVVVTSTVVVVAMIGLYTNFSRLHKLYKSKENYYSVDGVYATKEIINSLLNSNLNTFINQKLENAQYTYIIKEGTCLEALDICSQIKQLYDVKNMIFARYDKCVLNEKECKVDGENTLNVTNETFKEYINYVIKYYDIENANTKYQYIVLTEIEKQKDDKSNNYYSNLRIR